jgi:Ni,Fe-hydrogenase III large subunit
MMGITISEKAAAVRTLVLELERLYNHIGDIGNMCAGTAFAVGYMNGAVIKERLMQLNERLTGSRYLRGLTVVGGVTRDVFSAADDILKTLDQATKDYKDLMELLLGAVSHIERLENTGRLSRDIARKLGVTGVAARASGLPDDLRKSHPHLLYDRLIFEAHTLERGDVFARMMVRSEEIECSISMVQALIESAYQGELTVPLSSPSPYASALGYCETPRGSLFYWVMADKDGKPLRVKFRSPSYCNWPAVPFAVHGNIVPDFPLCNKSFNLSYSGTDM